MANDENPKPEPKAERESNEPILPSLDERMELVFVDAPHPSVLPTDALLQMCELRTQRRSGPGGQHRNKTSSGAFLTHKATGIVAEATERRSQAQNRDVACERLRYRMAVEVRTKSIVDVQNVAIESGVRDAYRGKSLRMNDSNPAKPGVLALLPERFAR